MSPWLGGAILSSGANPTTLFWTFTASALMSAVVLTVLYRIKTPTTDSVVTHHIPALDVR
jgi:hypothetical protein